MLLEKEGRDPIYSSLQRLVVIEERKRDTLCL